MLCASGEHRHSCGQLPSPAASSSDLPRKPTLPGIGLPPVGAGAGAGSDAAGASSAADASTAGRRMSSPSSTSGSSSSPVLSPRSRRSLVGKATQPSERTLIFIIPGPWCYRIDRAPQGVGRRLLRHLRTRGGDVPSSQRNDLASVNCVQGAAAWQRKRQRASQARRRARFALTKGSGLPALRLQFVSERC